MNIVEVIPQPGHRLIVKLETGERGVLDVRPFLTSEAFAPLASQAEFEKVHNGRYFVEWECGADLSVDTIAARWQRIDKAALSAADHPGS